MENFGAGEVAPCKGITRADWRLRRQQSVRSTLSGETDVMVLGVPYWEVSVTVSLPDRTDYFDLWSSFIERRRGGDHTFLLPRTFRPGARDVAGSSFPSASVANYSAPSSVLQISGASAWKPRYGDMISYETVGGGLWIGQVMQDENSADPVSVQVEPKTVSPASPSNLRILDALGEFALDGEPTFREGHKRRSLRFKAKQVIR